MEGSEMEKEESTHIKEFRQQLTKLDENCADPSDTLFEKFDLAVELISKGPQEQQCAMETLTSLIASSRPRDVLDLHSLLMGRLSSITQASEFACTSHLLALTLQQFTKHEERHWPSCFNAIADVLQQRSVIQDNVPEVVELSSDVSPNLSPASSALSSGDFYQHHHNVYQTLVVALSQNCAVRPWAHRAILLQFCFRLLSVEICSRCWPAARLESKAGIPALTPSELVAVAEDFSKPVGPILEAIMATEVQPLFVMQYATGWQDTDAQQGTDSMESGDDFSDFEDELDESELDDPNDKHITWDKVGVAAYCYTLVKQHGASVFPCLLQPEYLLHISLPFLQAMAEANNLVAAHIALAHLSQLLSFVPKYSIRILEPLPGPQGSGDEKEAQLGTGDLQSEEITTTSHKFETYFGFAQQLATMMALCPSQSHRQQAHDCLMLLYSKFAERTRHKMVVSSLKLCPYGPVKALLLLLVKDEVWAEYQALATVLKSISEVDRHVTIQRFCENSAFLRKETTKFVHNLIVTDMQNLDANMDSLMGALNLYRFLLGIDVSYDCMGVTSEQQHQAIHNEVLEPLGHKLKAQHAVAADGPRVLGGWMMMEVLDSIAEKLKTKVSRCTEEAGHDHQR